MSKLTKKQKTQVGKVDTNKLYGIVDALGLVKEFANAKFDESIDVAVQLGIDAKKSDQVVRGAVVLPNGTGKTKRVAVFAQAAKAEEDLRAMRLRNGREEGLYVLATEVSREVSQAIGQEVREVETYLRDVARTLADKLSVDFKTARQILMDGWREHRKGRSDAMTVDADLAQLSDAERAANI